MVGRFNLVDALQAPSNLFPLSEANVTNNTIAAFIFRMILIPL
jgi:hypothetical protein